MQIMHGWKVRTDHARLAGGDEGSGFSKTKVALRTVLCPEVSIWAGPGGCADVEPAGLLSTVINLSSYSEEKY